MDNKRKQLAYIFDMDGVLLDSMWIYRRTFQTIFKQEFGVDVSAEVHLSLAGRKNNEVVAGLAEYYNVGSIDIDEITKKVNEYCSSIIGEAEPIFENTNFARMLLDNGFPVACASGGPEIIVRASLERCGLSDITACITADQVTNGKPDPECFLKAAEAMGVLPQNCIVVEDALGGIQAAKAGGMKAMHYFRQGLFTC